MTSYYLIDWQNPNSMKYFPQSSKYLNNNTSEARRCLTNYEEKQRCHDDVIYQYTDLGRAKREAPVAR